MSIEAMRQALEALKTASASTRVEQERTLYEAAIKRLRNAIDELETMQTQEPDMRHPKVQAIIGARARLQIELRLVEQLLDDPEFETTASDMEYWGPLHDRLKERLHEVAVHCERRLKDVNTAAMSLSRDLVCMSYDDDERLDRDRVMARIMQWRNEWDKAMFKEKNT